MSKKTLTWSAFILIGIVNIVLYQNFSQVFFAVYPASSFSHQVGFSDVGGWAVTSSTSSGAMIYGPYVTNTPAQKMVANFIMLVDNNTADFLEVVTIDVNDFDANQVIASRTIRRSEMAAPYTDGTFSLPFDWTGRSGHRIEYRVWPKGASYVRVEGVTVQADVGAAALSVTPTVTSLASVYASEAASGQGANLTNDGNTSTYYSSNTFTTSANTRNVQYAGWMASASIVSQIQLTAKKVGSTIGGFPVSYHVYVANPALSAWVYVGYFSNQPDPTTGIATVELGGAYRTNGFVIQPDILGTDGGSYVFRLAEAKMSNDSSTGILSNMTLKAGTTLPFDKYTLAYQTDGNLVYYSNLGRTGQSIAISTNTFTDCSAAGACVAKFQTDGNLVLYKNGSPYWDAGTSGLTGAKFRLLRDFPHLAIVNSSGTTIWPYLDPNKALVTGQTEKIVFQEDGNLVHYLFQHIGVPFVLGSTATWGHSCTANCRAYFNIDGTVRLTQNGTTYYTGARPHQTELPTITVH